MTNVPEISIDDASELLEAGETVFVDVRDVDSYKAGHIETAHHLTNENVQEFIGKTAKDMPIIVYCYHGNSSIGATAFLMEQGYKNVQSMAGGFEAWRLSYDYETEDD